MTHHDTNTPYDVWYRAYNAEMTRHRNELRRLRLKLEAASRTHPPDHKHQPSLWDPPPALCTTKK